MADISERLNRLLSSIAPDLLEKEGEDEDDSELIKTLNEILTNGEAEISGGVDSQSTLCGKTLEVHEVAYCCKDCETDPTCVLCAKCFENSIHVNHRYRMITSGGGCCDCGDSEAWTSGVYCSAHVPKEEASANEEEDPLSSLPAVVMSRGHVYFLVLLRYCLDMMYWGTEERSLPQHLCQQATAELLETDSHYAMLYNDEQHSYDQVINTLTKNLKLGHVDAIGLTTTVDHKGRCVVNKGSKEECQEVVKLVNKPKFKPLRVPVFHKAVVAHQECAASILKHLDTLSLQSAGLRRLMSEAMLLPIPEEEGNSLLDLYFQRDGKAWKDASLRWQNFILHSIYIDSSHKKDLAVALTKNYKCLLENYSKGLQIRDCSATALSVQLFTAPSLTYRLIVEYDLLEVLFMTAKGFVEQSVEEGRMNNVSKSVNMYFVIYDLRYVLRPLVPAKEEWTSVFKEQFLKGFKVFLELLQLLEGVDGVVRQRGEHVASEVSWEPALSLWCSMQPVFLQIIKWCQADHEVMQKAVEMTLGACLNSEEMSFTQTVPPLVKYFIGEKIVSVHYPLHRLLGGLLTGSASHELQLSDLLTVKDNNTSKEKVLLHLLEKPLRSIVLSGQVMAGMWKRNGFSVLNQVYNYQFHNCQQGMYDLDVVMIKTVAAILEPHAFLHALLHKYRLQNWYQGNEDPTLGRDESADDALRFLVAEAEEFVFLLNVVLGEHYYPGIGKVTKTDCLKREILHCLYIKSYSHSDLVKQLKNYDETDISEALKGAAVFKRNAQGHKGMYEIAPHCEDQHNLFFYHYSKTDQSKALEARRKRSKTSASSQKTEGVPLATPPPLCDLYRGILRLIHSRTLWQVLLRIFKWNNKLQSERLIHLGLHLCGLMILQEEATGKHDFTDCASDPLPNESLLDLLEDLLQQQKFEENRPLLQWIVEKLQTVRQLRLGTPVDGEGVVNVDVPMESSVPAVPTVDKTARAASMREKLLKDMARRQQSFLKEHGHIIDTLTTPPSTESMKRSLSSSENDSLCVVGPKSLRIAPEDPIPNTCILCQGDDCQDGTAGPAGVPVLGVWIQRSVVLGLDKSNSSKSTDQSDFEYSPLDLSLGVHTNSCGHMMHFECFEKFRDSKLKMQPPRLLFHQNIQVQWVKGEFLCPLCQFHCNSVLPILPVKLKSESKSSDITLTLSEFTSAVRELFNKLMPLEEEEQMKKERVPGPGCSNTTQPQVLAELFPKYLKIEPKKNSEPMSLAVDSCVKEFTERLFTIGLNTDPNDEDDRICTTAWNSCSFTIFSYGQLQRERGKPFFTTLSSRNMQHFEGLVRTVSEKGKCLDSKVLAKQARHIFDLIFGEAPDDSLDVPSIANVEAFTLTVYLHFVVKSLVLTVSQNEDHSIECGPLVAASNKIIVEVAVCILLVQFLLTIPPEDQSEEHSVPSDDDLLIAEVWCNFRGLFESTACKPSMVDGLFDSLKEVFFPFLQSTALFFHCVTGIPLPEGEPGFNDLCKYVALPSNPCQLLKTSTEYWQMVQKWCGSLKHFIKEGNSAVAFQRSSQPFMISLPEHYADLLKKATAFTCKRSVVGSLKDAATTVIQCLLCGELLCCNSYCCQEKIKEVSVGSFTKHIQSCGAGFGMGLWIRECRVVLVNAVDVEVTRGCLMPAPYLDEYGESDPGLKSGHPLTLHKESLKNLQDLWQSHELSGKITSELDNHREYLRFPWNKL